MTPFARAAAPAARPRPAVTLPGGTRSHGMNNMKRVFAAVALAGAALSVTGVAQAADGPLDAVPAIGDLGAGLPTDDLATGELAGDVVSEGGLVGTVTGGLAN